jgi:hypothetical protein
MVPMICSGLDVIDHQPQGALEALEGGNNGGHWSFITTNCKRGIICKLCNSLGFTSAKQMDTLDFALLHCLLDGKVKDFSNNNEQIWG